MDPPHPECVNAITMAHGAGVRVCMDYSLDLTGPEMDAMSDEELRSVTHKYNIFARASPQNKIHIVKAL
jgi:hypothetical protein